VRIAFVSVNRENLPDAVIPLGLLSVMTAVPEEHDKRFWDLCFEQDPVRALEERIAAERPELLALGLRNIWNNDYSGVNDNLGYYRGLMDAIRRATDAPVVVGGGGFSVMPERLMRHLRPDYGIWGEGERPLPMLVDALASGGGDLDAIPNLYRFDAETLVHGGRREAFVDVDTLPIVDRRVVDRRYYSDYGIDSVQSKRGCNLRCDYCTYPLIEGRVSRRRKPALVVDELFAVREQHPEVQHVFIVDSVFNLPPPHAKAICREIIERDPGVLWTCYANPLRFDDEMAELMVAAGCSGIEVGSDSGCDDILLRLKKDFDTARIQNLRDCAQRAGLKDCHSFILGTPGETLDHVRRTLDFIVDLDPFAAVLGCWVDDEESLDPELRAERTVLRERIHELLLEYRERYPRWIIPALGVNFAPRLFRTLRRAGMHGPLWQYIDRLPGAPRRSAPARAPARGLPVIDD